MNKYIRKTFYIYMQQYDQLVELAARRALESGEPMSMSDVARDALAIGLAQIGQQLSAHPAPQVTQ